MYKIEYDVRVKFLDDGKHFPSTFYTGWFYPGTSLTNTEIKEAILEDVKEKYEWNNNHTFEKDMADPAFIGIDISNIMICKSVDNVGVYIDGPAREKKIIYGNR